MAMSLGYFKGCDSYNNICILITLNKECDLYHTARSTVNHINISFYHSRSYVNIRTDSNDIHSSNTYTENIFFI